MISSGISILVFAYWAGQVVALVWHGNGHSRHAQKSGNAATAGIWFSDQALDPLEEKIYTIQTRVSSPGRLINAKSLIFKGGGGAYPRENGRKISYFIYMYELMLAMYWST